MEGYSKAVLSFKLIQYLSLKKTDVSFSRMIQTTLLHSLEIPEKGLPKKYYRCGNRSSGDKISSNSGTQQKEKEKTKKGMLEVKIFK